MSQNRTNGGQRGNGRDEEAGGWGFGSWGTAAAVIGGLAASAGGLYLLTRRREQDQSATDSPTGQQAGSSSSSASNSSNNMSDYLSGMMRNLNTNEGCNGGSNGGSGRRGVPRSSIPSNPVISNLNSLLSDIYLRYIALNDEDFERYYSVIHCIFNDIHKKMKEVDPYYNKYSSTVQYAGSHPDRLRINKPDEFDIDIVIGLPLSIYNNPLNPAESDFIIEPKDPGFIQLKMGTQFKRLHMRDGNDWQINKTAYEWKDDKDYLLSAYFSDWFKSVVNRALNKYKVGSSQYIFYVAGVPYTATKSESGPAFTLYLENRSLNFKLDVDLVPALRFPISRWPICSSYRNVPPEWAVKDYWMVVPKPNKFGTQHDKIRTWRIGMHEQERMIMHDTNNLRPTIQLIKKLRDAQNMNKIASYYIKTLFFWECSERNFNKAFWNQSQAELFKIMVKKFHDALVTERIPYFWNKNNNLIGKVDKGILKGYANIVGKLVDVLDKPQEFKQVARYLLTPEQFRDYNAKFLHI